MFSWYSFKIFPIIIIIIIIIIIHIRFKLMKISHLNFSKDSRRCAFSTWF
jgi:hypothetical protein